MKQRILKWLFGTAAAIIVIAGIVITNINFVAGILTIVFGIIALFVVLFLILAGVTRRQREALRKRIDQKDFSCIVLSCSCSAEKMRKFPNRFCINAAIYPKELDSQLVYRVQRLTSTAQEDEWFSAYRHEEMIFTFPELAALRNVTFILKEQLYIDLAQFEPSQTFYMHNEFLRIPDDTI